MSNRLQELYSEIKANEKRLRTILNTVHDGIMTLDKDGVILSLNPAVTQMLGYEKMELLGRGFNTILCAQSHDVLKEGFEFPYQDETRPDTFVRKIIAQHKLAHEVSLELSLNPMALEDATLFVATLRDLTLQERASRDVHRAELILSDAIESSNDGFVLYDSDDRLVICNQRYKEIYARSADLLVPGNSFEDIIRTGVARGQYKEALGCEEDWIAQRLFAHFNPGGPIEQKLEDGRWIRVWENKTENGSIVGFRIDITELKEREEALLESQDRFRATIESALDCIICINGDGHVMEFNPAAEKCFGYSREEALGREMAELIIPKKMRDAHRKGMAHYHATGEGPVLGKRIEVEAMRKNGEQFPVELAIEVASGSDDEILFVSYLRDITEQKAYENNLKTAKKRAEVANEAKAGFLAMMSHEIRTPLNGVLGVLGLMSETDLNEEQKKYVQIAKQSGESLLTIINDILDFSKMEAGKIQFEHSDVDLAPLVSSLTELLAPQAQAKRLTFRTVLDNNLPKSVLCDGGRLRQILLNLIGNAVKFTERGGIEIRLHRLNGNTGNVRLRFEVEDTGIGIPLDLQDQVFGEFSTIDDSYARKFGGTGLGLAITKKLVEIMKGDIGFESVPNKGTLFWFELEMAEGNGGDQTALEEPNPTPDQLRPLRILIAEDHPTNMMITRKILEKQGHSVISAADGLEAITQVQEFPLDLVLMDGSMPEMDGMAATEHIRQMDAPFCNIPIIALTAHAMKGDREKFIKAGMNDYLKKPIRKEALLKAIAKWAPLEPAPLALETPEQQDKTLPLMDENVLIKLGEDTDPEMVPELIQIYLNDAQERLERMHRALREKDYETLELETHTLGSSAATYGLMVLHHQARRAEAALVEGRLEDGLLLCQKVIETAGPSWRQLGAYSLP